jgi:hypothetical protein
MHWALRFILDPDIGFPTGDQPVICDAARNTPEEAVQAPETVWVCPLAWDMALFGSIAPFEHTTQRVSANDLERVRYLFRSQSARFIVSPLPMF